MEPSNEELIAALRDAQVLIDRYTPTKQHPTSVLIGELLASADEPQADTLERGISKFDVLVIAVAYEQGCGHANRAEIINPYSVGSPEHYAWQLGRDKFKGRPDIAPEPQQPNLHPRTADLVDRFSLALKEKLAAAEIKYGYSDGWAEDDWMTECRARLLDHIEKGDPRDVAAYCAFLWHHGESTTPQHAPEPQHSLYTQGDPDAPESIKEEEWMRRPDLAALADRIEALLADRQQGEKG